jgi:hypothetical protein
VTWDPITSPCDYILLASKRSPGIAEVRGASSPRKWDERDGLGITGAFSVFTGRGLAHFSVVLRLYSAQDWQDWHEWKPIVDRLPTRRGGEGKDSGKLAIWHPLLQTLDIKAVGVAEVMQPDQTGDGEWSIEIKFVEFRVPKVTLAKPEGADETTAEAIDPIEENWIKPLTSLLQVERLASE